jgi:hypothetical protein
VENEEINTFLDTYAPPPQLNQEDSNNLNTSVSNDELETVVKKLPTEKVQVWMDSLLNSSRALKNKHQHSSNYS